jgi:YD repeat-containing protein
MLVNHRGNQAEDPPYIQAWDLESGELAFESGEAVAGRAMDLNASSGLVATAASDDRVRVRDLRTGLARASFPMRRPAYMLRLRPDGGAMAIALEEGGIEIRDLSGRLIRSLANPGITFAVDWSADGKLLAASHADRTASIWDAGTGARIATLLGHQAEVDE